jgi:hypothetical protein
MHGTLRRMAVDVAVVAILTSGVVGVTGVLTPAWLGLRADRLFEKRRRREKREAVYIDALEVARIVRDHHVGELIGNPAPTSESVTDAYKRTHAERSIRARMDAYGSDTMRGLWRDFDRAWDAVGVGHVPSLKALAHCVDRMADQVNAELA